MNKSRLDYKIIAFLFCSEYITSSLLQPLHDSLVVTTDREQPLGESTSSESGSDDVLGVSSVTSWHVSDSAWISKSGNESEIITASDKRLVLVEINTVDVGSIGSLGEDTVDEPSEFGVASCPDSAGGVGSTTWVLVTTWHREVEELVGVADGLNVSSVHGPVDAGNGSIVLGGLANHGIASGLIDVDVGVVRSDGKVAAIWTILGDLNPFEGIDLFVKDSVEIREGSDGHGSIVGADSEVALGTHSKCPGSLRLGVLTHAAGLVSLGLSDLVADCCGVDTSTGDWIPLFDLVVVT